MPATTKYEGIIITRCAHGEVMIVTGPEEPMKELLELTMDEGSCLQDYGLEDLGQPPIVPVEPGIYICDVEFRFEQGYFEGYPAPGESSWYLIPTNVKRIA